MLSTIKDLYRFYINHPIDGFIEVFPANSTLDWSWKRQKGQIFFRKELSTELTFIGDDFKSLYKLDRSNYRCDKIIIEIHRKCDDAFTVFWTGYLALIDGDFNADRCKLKIKPRIEDQYTCLLSSWNNEKDFIVGVPATNYIKFIKGTIEYTDCTFEYTSLGGRPIITVGSPSDYPINGTCINFALGWGFIRNEITETSIITNTTTGEQSYKVTVKSVYGREVVKPLWTGVPIPPQGPGWVFIGIEGLYAVWARPVIGDVSLSELPPLQNGRKLNDVIQFLIDDCGLTYVSDFFNSNRDNTHPTNFAYDYADLYYQDVIIYQKSDIKRTKKRVINGSELNVQYATKAILKLKDLLTWMSNMFNVSWQIEDNIFRIEHYTYFRQNQNRIDLTSNNRIKGLNKYKYAIEELPNLEKWQWMEETNNTDFDGVPIKYDQTCSYQADDINEKEYPVTKITTNLEYIINNPDQIGDAGFVFVSTFEGVVSSDYGKITERSRLNGPLAFANLLYYLHRHGRPQRSGNLNGTDEAFFLSLPSREQDPISVPICCTDVDQFNPLHKIKTQLGWGFIDSAKLTDPKQVITFNLLHE